MTSFMECMCKFNGRQQILDFSAFYWIECMNLHLYIYKGRNHEMDDFQMNIFN